MRVIDKRGQTYGRLTVVSREANNKQGQARWACICECGNTLTVASGSLGRSTFSCGCLGKSKRLETLTTHGMAGTRIYQIWKGMHKRCKDTSRKDYHGRGIIVCDEWLTFEQFYKDMGPTYRDDLSIDRINNDGNYSSNNCRWATRSIQNSNSRRNIMLTLRGKEVTLTQAANELSLAPRTLWKRINSGWGIEKAMFTPLMKNQHV